MRKFILILSSFLLLGTFTACSEAPLDSGAGQAESEFNLAGQAEITEFEYEADRFADIRIMRYPIPGFDDFSIQQKKLLYFLSQAGMSGRDIMWDQNYKHNLRIRRTIEEIIKHYPGDRSTEEFNAFLTYAKQMWFASGIHHHYSNDKFSPEFTAEYFAEIIFASADNSSFPLDEGQSLADLVEFLNPVIFDPDVDPKKVNTSPELDKVVASAVNFYENVTEEEVVAFYESRAAGDNPRPVSWGLNSKLTRENGEIVEKVWKVGGMYTEAIEQIVYWLEQAISVAETNEQSTALELLIRYYRSGDLADFDAYNIAWVADTESPIDMINGFIEVYNDPLGYRGSFESVVSIRDEDATLRIGRIAEIAQWFEDNSPIMDEHKKAEVVGITGKAIIVVSETGDASPATPVGINLPNSSWIRTDYGSKSVSLSNITAAYNSSEGGTLEEFAWSEQEIERSKTYREIGGHLFTDMHEVIGHASGKINEGIGTTRETLKQYASPMEEARADLVALYFMMDSKLLELGVMPSLDVGRARYDSYIRNGLMTQLYRIEPGNQIEEAHMRNRQEIAAWAYERGLPENVIERIVRDNKTYFLINDYQRLREIFGELLREHQRIKSEGDFAAAQFLIENYGTQVDLELHTEVLERYAALNVAPYSGFINPRLVPVVENTAEGVEIIDVSVEYPDDFVSQMLEYADRYSFLPTIN